MSDRGIHSYIWKGVNLYMRTAWMPESGSGLSKSFYHISIFEDYTRAHSLDWLERPADNREVESSNLFGPTITPSGVDENSPFFLTSFTFIFYPPRIWQSRQRRGHVRMSYADVSASHFVCPMTEQSRYRLDRDALHPKSSCECTT